MSQTTKNPLDLVENKFCSVCAEQLDIYDVEDDLVIQRILGYGSEHDCEEHRIQFCNKCLDKLIASCKRSTFIRNIE